MTKYNRLERAVEKLIISNEINYIRCRETDLKEQYQRERGLLLYVYKGITGKDYRNEVDMPVFMRY